MSDNYTADSEKFEIVHKMSRRIASVDKYCVISVANKAFEEYFGEIKETLIEVVAPQDKERLMDFIEKYDGTAKSGMFKFINAQGIERYNHLFVYERRAVGNGHMRDIELVDVESIEEANKSLRDDVSKHKMLLGLDREYTFTYNRDNGIFSMYRYDVDSRDVIYKSDIDEWKKRMLSEGYIDENDKEIFANFISEVRSYTQTFSIKFRTSMRTYKRVKETLRFKGTVMNKSDGSRIVIGRVVPEADSHGNYNQVTDMIEELQFDSLTHVYNKKTITAYAVKCLKEEQNNRVTIAVLDVDHFKKVNDVYGHMYGDKVLARVGRKLKEVVGEDGVVGRIGGDEFVIIFNGINDEHELRGMLRAIRTQIKWEFVDDFEDLMITCSIGAAYSPNNGHEYEELFKKADYCLYVAKEKGRDRYVFFRDDLHKDSYENSLNTKDKNVNDGREMKELRFLTGIMENFSEDGKAAIKELIHHMYDTFKLDSINLYWGANLNRAYYMGVELGGSMNADYVKTEGFKKLLDGKNHAAVGFVGRQADLAPEFGTAMREKRVFSTVQCIIGSPDNVKGLFTIDRCKESAQWAEYEIEMAVVTASLINILAETECDEN